MRGLAPAVVTAVILAGVAILAADETVSISLPFEHTALAEGPGRGVTETQCRVCHSLDYVTTQPPSGAAQWQGVVTKMRTVYGAPISDAEAKTIADYLTSAYGAR
jgi:sulfite dehydrogenase (cytochrome) subunit B